VKKLFVGNLPWAVTTDDLVQLFSQYGDVQDAIVLTDRETGRSRGFGFVEMPDEQATAAIEALNGFELQGREIVVNEARPKRDE